MDMYTNKFDKNIPIVEVQNSEKLILYNHDFQLLTFFSSSHQALIIPSSRQMELSSFYQKLMNQLVDYKGMQSIYQSVEYRLILENYNNHLEKKYLKIIRSYFSYYKYLKKEDYEFITQLANSYDLFAYMLSFQEICTFLSKKKDSQSVEYRKVYNQLEEKLYYKSY